MLTHEKLIEIAIGAALDAEKAIMEIYLSGDFEKETKNDDSPVTTADKDSQTIIIQRLAATGLPVLSEEVNKKSWAERKDGGKFWMVGPQNWAKEFVNKNGNLTVNIALIECGKPVAGVIYLPRLDILYCGSKETGVFKITDEKRN